MLHLLWGRVSCLCFAAMLNIERMSINSFDWAGYASDREYAEESLQGPARISGRDGSKGVELALSMSCFVCLHMAAFLAIWLWCGNALEHGGINSVSVPAPSGLSQLVCRLGECVLDMICAVRL